MASLDKFKPMIWDCNKDGCFNEKMRLDFGVFYDCFPGKISFTDVDGIVEINKVALMLEWKSGKAIVYPGSGQDIMYRKHIQIRFDINNLYSR